MRFVARVDTVGVMAHAALIRRAQVGDHEAFAALVLPHQAQLRALVAFYLPNGSDTLEVVQDALVDAYRALRRFEAERDLGPWLRTLCRNRARKFLRDQASRRRLCVPMDEWLAATEDEADRADEGVLQRLRQCLEALNPRQRALLSARYVDGRSVQDLAGERGTSPNAVSMLLLRLKSTLRSCVERRVGAST